MFKGLGVLPGGDFTLVGGLSADGSTVVGVGNSSASSGFPPGEAFRWTLDGGMVGLGFLPDTSVSGANGVSADGSTVVGVSGNQAFSWTSRRGMVGLGFLPGATSSQADGVSADGSTVIGLSGQNTEAFRWTSTGGMMGLGFLPGGSTSWANAVSAHGSAVVGYSDSTVVGTGGREAFLWTSTGGMRGLGVLPSTTGGSVANAVSADGSTVVGASGAVGTIGFALTTREAFRWTAKGGMVGLGFLTAVQDSTADGVTADGSTIVGSSGQPNSLNETAFIWDSKHGMRDLSQVLTGFGLNLTGWTLTDATISANGQTLAGDGFDPNGAREAWIATIPEPATDLLVMAGVLWLAMSRRKRA